MRDTVFPPHGANLFIAAFLKQLAQRQVSHAGRPLPFMPGRRD